MRDDPKARFEKVFADYFDTVLRFALARTPPETAKDATAETFLAAWRNFGDVPDEPRAWLLAIARNKIVDQYREAGRRDAIAASLEPLAGTSQRDPGEVVAENNQIRSALAALAPNDQELLRLVAWDGLSQREAAVVLGCSEAVFRVRLHRARHRLRRLLSHTSDPTNLSEPQLRMQESK